MFPFPSPPLPPPQVEEAIARAFMSNGDEDFERLLELCGAADFRDAAVGCPAVNHPHRETG